MKSQHIHPKGLMLAASALAFLFAAGATRSAGQEAPSAFKPFTPPHVVDGTAALVEHYNPNQTLRLAIALQPPHWAEEQQFLQDLQTKGSPQFHQFLTAEQWNARFSPSVADEQAVADWATSQGMEVTHRYPNRLIVDVAAPASTLEKAFGVTMNSYQSGTRTFFSNDRDPQLPANLRSIVQAVIGLNNWEGMRPNNKNLVVPSVPDYTPGPVVGAPVSTQHDGDGSGRPVQKGKNGAAPAITGGAYDPTDIYSSEAYNYNALYNQGHCCNPLGAASSPPEASIAVATVGSQNFNDIAGFHSHYPYLAYNLTEIGIDGQSVPCTDATDASCDGEGTLDMEWTTATANSFGAASNTAHVYMYDNNSFWNFHDSYNQMLTDGYARVASTSWSCTELAQCSTGYMDSLNCVFSSMVGQGWTLVAAQGDRGSTDDLDPDVDVAFPGTNPNVVSAGGTTLRLDSSSNYVSEVTWSGGPAGAARNDGGTGGGCSQYYNAPAYQSNQPCGSGSRAVPDIALNADWYNTPQNMYMHGLGGNGGTSIVAPELAGFFAQENAYLLYLGSICGGGGSSPCAPMGNINYFLYDEGIATGAPHYPFYDITSGCNNNDITAYYDLGYYCAGPGWDAVTGWGSANMLQLAWAVNWYHVPGFSAPTVAFDGPATSHWYNTDQLVIWTVTAPSLNGYPSDGVAGFSFAWDSDPGDAYSEATPGAGNSFYSGPQSPNATFGCLSFTGGFCAGGVGQGWHTVHVRAWGNEGEGSGDASYGPIGYDTIPPVTTASLGGTLSGGAYVTAVLVTLAATDNASGVASTVYQLDDGRVQNYAGPFVVSAAGAHSVLFHSTDVAGNVEATKSVSFTITEPTATSLTSSMNPSGIGKRVTFTTVVASTSSVTGTAIGTVTFKDGATVLATKTLSGGTATFGTSALALGNHTMTASYSGSTYFFASTSPALNQVVNNVSATSLASSLNPSTYGQAVTFTATVSHTASPVPTGTVTFKDGSATLGTSTLDSSGIATLTTSTLAAASHTITAVYGGDANYLGSTSAALHQVVNKATTSSTVASSLNPSHHGQKVTFTATVTSTAGTPTGFVEFMDGATLLSAGALSGGTAAFSTAVLTTGTHNITVAYIGSSNFAGSTSPILVQTVNP